jgi:hypothetical protein
MSVETERDVGEAISLAARWRKLEREALDAVGRLADPEAKWKMLFVAESYRELAERNELRAELLEALAESKRGPGSTVDMRGNSAEKVNEA